MRTAAEVELDQELLQAAQDGNLEVVQILLEKGANIEVKDICSGTPLYWAFTWDKLDVAKSLIGHGAKIDEKIQNDPEFSKKYFTMKEELQLDKNTSLIEKLEILSQDTAPTEFPVKEEPYRGLAGKESMDLE